ncbi:3-phosphoshikimate 1-carboxyvinyltransferase 2 [Triticum aestivum]|uniref:3-phosphoshikimate 1-carboxyvinyltransferase 2 n=1 Tax=Triticum aestivum TaxID=4565 RepID=UPI001D012070|nr:3-phosphoshikimate 1-carboxyvinyltransferase 2-like [Triticum aestivum]
MKQFRLGWDALHAQFAKSPSLQANFVPVKPKSRTQAVNDFEISTTAISSTRTDAFHYPDIWTISQLLEETGTETERHEREIGAKDGIFSQVKLSGSISSQYLSSLPMAAPLALGDVEIEIIDKLISVPYIEMTLKLMERFGMTAEHSDSWGDIFYIKGGQKYRSPGNAYVEGDASSASYFLAGAAITGGTVTVEGCGTTSLQGDVKFAEVLEMMGAKVTWTDTSVSVTGPPRQPFGRKHLKAVDVNMNKMPDVAMILAVVALFADGPTAIRDVASWRVKETERMVAIRTELTKLGATVEEGPDYCIITPPEKLNVTAIDTYDDHRMAMAFSLAACAEVPVTIRDPGCTRKTFPNYFDVLSTFLGATVEEGPDYCIITPPEKLNVMAIDTYDDHRMAMAFSLAACTEVPVTIRDPGCTRKTFPNYFDVLSTFMKN